MNEESRENTKKENDMIEAVFGLIILALAIWGVYNWVSYGHVLGKSFITDSKLKGIATEFVIDTIDCTTKSDEVSTANDHYCVPVYVEYPDKTYEICNIWISKDDCEAYYIEAYDGSPLMAKLRENGWK